jgi:hypothetical protein
MAYHMRQSHNLPQKAALLERLSEYFFSDQCQRCLLTTSGPDCPNPAFEEFLLKEGKAKVVKLLLALSELNNVSPSKKSDMLSSFGARFLPSHGGKGDQEGIAYPTFCSSDFENVDFQNLPKSKPAIVIGEQKPKFGIVRELAAPEATNLFGAMVRKVQEPDGFGLKLGIPCLPPLPASYTKEAFEGTPDLQSFTSFMQPKIDRSE